MSVGGWSVATAASSRMGLPGFARRAGTPLRDVRAIDRDRWVVVHPDPPGQVASCTDTDPRSPPHRVVVNRSATPYVQGRGSARHVGSVETTVDAERDG